MSWQIVYIFVFDNSLCNYKREEGEREESDLIWNSNEIEIGAVISPPFSTMIP